MLLLDEYMHMVHADNKIRIKLKISNLDFKKNMKDIIEKVRIKIINLHAACNNTTRHGNSKKEWTPLTIDYTPHHNKK